MYGTEPGPAEEFAAAVGAPAMVLSAAEDAAFTALSLDRFAAVGSTRLDWRGARVLRRVEDFDATALRGLLAELAAPQELAVLFWGNLAVPSVALDAARLAEHAEALLDACGREFWVFLVDSGVLIEFQDGAGLTAGRPPAR
ncbi:hypothetical protein ACWEQL_14900 [Kitasatospora sp. NPDC004240]